MYNDLCTLCSDVYFRDISANYFTFDEIQSCGVQRNPIQMKDGTSRRML